MSDAGVRRWVATLILASGLVSLLLLLAEPALASMSWDTYGYDDAAQPRQPAGPAELELQIHLDHRPHGDSASCTTRRYNCDDRSNLVSVHARVKVERVAPNTRRGTSIARYDPDFAVSQLTRNFDAKASQLADFGSAQGWKPVQSATGPLEFVDGNGISRLTIKQGSPRTPGSGHPHVEMRNAAGQRIDAFGNAVTRRSPGNHTPIIWDLP